MRKLGLVVVFAVGLVLFLAGMGSAYYSYGYGNYGRHYDDYSYHSSRSYGGYYGPSYRKTVDYDKRVDTRYLGWGGYEKRTTYTKTVRYDNDLGYGYGYVYPRQNYYYSYYPRHTYYYGYW